MQSHINPQFFTRNEACNLEALIRESGHRQELKQLIRNLHNDNDFEALKLASLMRYVDSKQLEAVFILLRHVSSGNSIESAFESEYFWSLI
ncbi:hypothetical protein [Moritella dasanensis]|uniref:hypothetical protein n=1 Tax=Moritella dasanensis TaxID=428031 RepID=UPI000362AABB|nr:hypothetical protein [Moritella dasanensis]